jgi:predicted thioredoxin/glutaredoxin
MKVEVFEAGCCGASNVYELVSQVSGGRAEVVRFTDQMEAIKRGIMRTPAVVVGGKVMCAGRAPKREEIEGWLTGGKA